MIRNILSLNLPNKKTIPPKKAQKKQATIKTCLPSHPPQIQGSAKEPIHKIATIIHKALITIFSKISFPFRFILITFHSSSRTINFCLIFRCKICINRNRIQLYEYIHLTYKMVFNDKGKNIPRRSLFYDYLPIITQSKELEMH